MKIAVIALVSLATSAGYVISSERLETLARDQVVGSQEDAFRAALGPQFCDLVRQKVAKGEWVLNGDGPASACL